MSLEEGKADIIGDSDVNIQSQVGAEQIRMLYRQTVTSVVGSAFTLAIITYGLFGHVSPFLLSVWGGGIGLVTFTRFVLWRLFLRRKPPEEDLHRWGLWFRMASLLAAFVWGIGAFILPPGAQTTQDMLFVVCLAGMAAGATATLSSFPGLYIRYLLLMAGPFVIWCLLPTNQKDVEVTLLTISFIILLWVISGKLHSALRESLVLRFENKQLAQELQKIALFDPLTTLGNRNLFHREFERDLAIAKRQGHTLSIIMMDLNRFKEINDVHGHAAGDAVLAEMGNRLNSKSRQSDVFFRWGGDEFTGLLHPGSDVANVRRRIHAICSEPVIFGALQIPLSVSLGLATFPKDGETQEVLLRVADAAMYEDKKTHSHR